MPKEPTISDLMNEGSIQRIQKMFNAFGFEIKMDPLALANKNQNKESIMSQVLNDLDNSPRIIKLLPKAKSDITDIEDIEAANKDKNLKDNNFYNLIRCLILNSLRDEAAALLYQKEKLKEMQIALHHYIMLLKTAEQFHQFTIEDNEIIRFKMRELQAAEAKLNSCVSNVLSQSHADSLSKLNYIQKDIADYHIRLSHHKERKKELKKDLKSASQSNAEDIIKNNIHFKGLSNNPASQQALADFIYEYKKQLSKTERSLYKMDEKTKKAAQDENLAQKREFELNNKLQQLESKKMELKYPSDKGFISADRFVSYGRISDPGKMEMIKHEMNEVRAELGVIAEERKERARKQAIRVEKVANFENKKSELFDSVCKNINNEGLLHILKIDDAKKSLISELNTKSDPEQALMENHKEKVHVKGLLKEKHKEAKQVIVQNDKIHALHGIASQHQSAKQPADKRHELHHIHQSIEAQRLERKQQKQEKKEKKAALR